MAHKGGGGGGVLRTVAVESLPRAADLRKNGPFLSVPYVCPEPVLAKRSHLYINGSKKTVFTHLRLLGVRNVRRYLPPAINIHSRLRNRSK